MSRRSKSVLAVVCALVVVAVGWTLAQSSSPAAPTASGVPTCPVATLPPEATDTIRDIHSNGPFPFPRNDGVVFGNREGHLPEEAKSYYREYTVVTPGAHTRSTRRVITGGAPATDPREYFYTDDHYDSFCLITDAAS